MVAEIVFRKCHYFTGHMPINMNFMARISQLTTEIHTLACTHAYDVCLHAQVNLYKYTHRHTRVEHRNEKN